MSDMKFERQISSEDRFSRSLSIMIIIVLIYLIFYAVTFSWFGESKLAVSPPIIIGDISLVVEHDYTNNLVLEPNKIYENTLTTITTETDVDAYIKIQLETDKKIDNQTVTNKNLVLPNFLGTSSWKIGADGWYYYIGFINDTSQVSFNLQATKYLTINQKGLDFTITLTIEAIQKDYLDLEDLQDETSQLYSWKDAPSEFIDYITPTP